MTLSENDERTLIVAIAGIRSIMLDEYYHNGKRLEPLSGNKPAKDRFTELINPVLRTVWSHHNETC